MRDPSDVKKAIDAAAAMVRALPPELREVAFTKAFDALIGAAAPRAPTQPPIEPQDDTALPPPARQPDIDRTKWYPLAARLPSTQMKTLLVLRALRDDMGTEWVSPATVYQVLSGKLRQPVRDGAVRMALVRGGRYVDRREGPGGPEYRLMAPGDEALDHVAANASAPAQPARAKKPRTSKRSGKPVSGTKAIQALMAAGFFGTSRTLADIVDHLARKRALIFRQEELSTVLTRLVRRGELDREKNGDGVYTYHAHPPTKDQFIEGIIKRDAS